MKKLLSYLVLAAGLILSSCDSSKLDPLSGDFLPAPLVVKLTNVDNNAAFKDDAGRWNFDLTLSEGGSQFRVVFIGNKYYLASNTYTEAPEASAKNGNFVLGKTTFNGRAAAQGSVTVRQTESAYSISAVLFMEDGTPYKIEWEGTLVYEKAPLPPVGYDFTIADPADVTDANNATVAGVKSYVVTLNDLTTKEFAAQFNLILNEGSTNIEGRYPVKEYASEDHTAGNGFDLGVYFGMAPGAYVIGSYYKENGEIVIINPGEAIEIYVEEGHYVFECSSATFVADKKQEEKPDNDAVALDTFLSFDNYTGWGVPLVGVSVGNNDVTYTAPDYVTSFMPTYSGNGNMLKAEFYSADGTIAAGEYKPCADENNMQPGEFKAGSANGGTTWYVVKDGNATGTPIKDGTIKVSVKGKVYTIEVKSSTVNAKYVGKLSNEPETVGLTDFLSFTNYYAMYGVKLAGAELATPGFTYSATFDMSTYSMKYDFPVDGAFLKLELYIEGESFVPGVYTPSVDADNVAAGEFKTGNESGGTTWYVVENGEMTSKPVTDGTVTVVKDGDFYSITLTSSVVNAKYVGKLTAPAE